MSDENKTNNANNSNSKNNGGTGVAPLLIQEEMKSCYLDYAMSVIIGRALPDVRDGLKPVHKRILYSMHMLNNIHNRAYVKSARVVGEVIGKYHPHGDSSVYGTMVRLAQDFSMRYQLIDGQGNFGSIDGDNAAAMRYTEVRMKRITEELLEDIDKDTVDWQPNYDGSLKEPIVLPTKIPNLLINGSTGIAVGMATNIPPHNLTEIMSGLINLIERPEITLQELMKIIPGPDFPTAGTIHGLEGIRSAYTTGKGIIQVRAKAEIEHTEKGGRERIVITELPYQVNKARLIEKIAYLVNHKEIEGISDIRDESNRLGIRVAIDIKKGDDSNVILNRLYKHTQLQTSYGIIFLAIHNNRPKLMNLKELLVCFIDHRREIVVRRTRFELNKAKEKAHILEGLKLAVENMDAVIEMIKHSKDPSEARSNLMSNYPLSEIQASAILEMRLQRLTGLEKDKIVKDYNIIIEEIKRLEEILASEVLVNAIIKAEFEEILEKYGDERKTQIIANIDEINIEDLIKRQEVFVTLTHKGYIKRMAIDTYRAQRRGGVGVKGADNVEDDFFTHIFIVNTHTDIMFFTDKGNVFSLRVYDIPEGQRTSRGKNIVNIFPIAKEETIKAVIPIPEDLEEKYVVVATERGLVKKSPLIEYKNIKYSGLKAIKIVSGDALIDAAIIEEKIEKDVLLCSSSGKIIRFDSKECRPQGRVSQGVRGMNIDDKEKIIGMEIVDDNVELLSVTENGYGKRSKAEEYRKQSRGGKGILGAKLTEKTGDIVQMKAVNDKGDLMVITNAGQVIRMKMSEISLLGRHTQGVMLIRVKEDEKVVAIEDIADDLEVEERLKNSLEIASDTSSSTSNNSANNNNNNSIDNDDDVMKAIREGMGDTESDDGNE
ncbi:MAG: DNA gyrase subunit A [Oligoflexia bacterium]|nr:DNA gyrase subunit A [Oligoflexia bacterium]